MLRWTRGEVGAEAGIKACLVIVLEVVVVVVAELKNDGVVPNPAPAPAPASVENIDARKGFAPPSIPVACGLNPPTSPVG